MQIKTKTKVLLELLQLNIIIYSLPIALIICFFAIHK